MGHVFSAPPDRRAALPAALARIAETAVRHDRDGSFPHDGLAALHAAGLLALTVPARLGGGGGGLALAAQAVQAVGGACASTGLIFAMQLIHQHWLGVAGDLPEPLRARIGRAAVEEGALVNSLRVEPQGNRVKEVRDKPPKC